MAKKSDLLAAMDRIDAADPCPTHGKATLAVCDRVLRGLPGQPLRVQAGVCHPALR